MAATPDGSIEVVPYSGDWPVLFEQARTELAAILGPDARSIEHIGSTAVPGLSSKPTIDILVVVESTDAFLRHLPDVAAAGYDHRPSNTMVGSDEHLFLRKVSNGKRTHHVHVLVDGSPEIDDYRFFRDALRSDPDLVTQYEQVKVELARTFVDDRTGYVDEKSKWVTDAMSALRSTDSR